MGYWGGGAVGKSEMIGSVSLISVSYVVSDAGGCVRAELYHIIW